MGTTSQITNASVARSGLPQELVNASLHPAGVPHIQNVVSGPVSRSMTPHGFQPGHGRPVSEPMSSPGLHHPQTTAAASFLNKLNNKNTIEKQPPGEEFNHAILYLNKIKARYSDEPNVYKQFLDILQTYQKEQKHVQDVGSFCPHYVVRVNFFGRLSHRYTSRFRCCSKTHPTCSQSLRISYLMPFLRTSVPEECCHSLPQNQVPLMLQERNLHRHPSATENEYQKRIQHLYFLQKLYHHGYVLHDNVVEFFYFIFLVFLLPSSRRRRSIIIALKTNLRHSLHTQSLTHLLKPMFSPSVKVLPHILT